MPFSLLSCKLLFNVFLIPCFLTLKTAGQDQSLLFQTVNEHPEPISAEIRGNLPPWLNGTLLRNGPGRFECDNISFNHWFDGQSLVHRFNIQGGHVTYSNAFVRSESYADSLKHGLKNHLEFGTFVPPDPCYSIFARLFSRYFGKEVPMDNTNVNVINLKNKTFAVTETQTLFEINPSTLETLKAADLTEQFPGVTINSALAHPHYTVDGSVINLAVSYGITSKYRIIHIPPSSRNASGNPFEGGKVISTITPRGGFGYVHSFALTENFIIVVEGPLKIDIWRVLSHRFFGSSPEDWLYWDKKQQTHFYVIDRKNGEQVGLFTADPFLVFHHVNAFQKDGNINIDASCYHNDSIIRQMALRNLRSPMKPGQKRFEKPEVRRYKLPIGELNSSGGKKALEKKSDGLDYTLLLTGMDLPRINYEEYNGKPYRFVYGVIGSDEMVFSKLCKLNVETKENVLWEEPGGFVSEPVFVKNPEGKEEDDGVVLASVINVNDQTSSLLVLDAREFKELGRAVVKGITPATFHGIFQHK